MTEPSPPAGEVPRPVQTDPAPGGGQPNPLDLTPYPPRASDVQPSDVVALVLGGFWVIGAGLYLLLMPQALGTGSTAMNVLAFLLPLALIWLAANTIRTKALLREEAARLQAAIDAMRHTYVQQAQGGAVTGHVAAQIPLAQTVQTAPARTPPAPTGPVATFATGRPAPVGAPGQPALTKPGVARGEAQPALPLGAPPEALAPPLSIDDFIGALNFPKDETDRAGFAQLRRALADPRSAGLVRAAQDALTLLSQDGIYMDDLDADRARPEIWRKFAKGERGRAISSLGGVRDREALASCATRMRADPVFRDTAHHFLRRFDQTIMRFAEVASDAEITQLSGTRTARAFMLLGRVMGTFD